MPRKKTNKKAVVTKKRTTAQQERNTSNARVIHIRWGESYISLLLGAMVVIFVAVVGFIFVKMQQPRQELLPPATIAKHINVTIDLTNPAGQQIAQKQTTVAQHSTPTPKTNKNTQVVTAAPIEEQGNQKIHTVQKGENLWTIAEKEYGSGYSYVSIEQANHLNNPGLIFSGDKLVIPSVTPILLKHQVSPTAKPTVTLTAAPRPTATPTVAQKPQVMAQPTPTIAFHGILYTVQKGDSLWTIAIKSYGNGFRWIDIAKANHLTDPSVIHVGNNLKIPRP